MADDVEKPARRVLYCPKCGTRYTFETAECVSCKSPLSEKQPRDESLFRPKIDLPFAAFAVLYFVGYGRLTGEAQSFGLIALIVGFAAIVAFRTISYYEWLGRR
ncbi:MAG TPA: hypothetical protein PLF26_13445 [Blastocatellia bacterium]|nr:hypothetical protein [Blastocatellia bacterium]